jgi:hypothetical protein
MRVMRVSQRRGYSGILFGGVARALLRQPKVGIPSAHQIKKKSSHKQSVKSAKDVLVISKKLKPNEKTLMRVYSQGRSGFVALEAK